MLVEDPVFSGGGKEVGSRGRRSVAGIWWLQLGMSEYDELLQ